MRPLFPIVLFTAACATAAPGPTAGSGPAPVSVSVSAPPAAAPADVPGIVAPAGYPGPPPCPDQNPAYAACMTRLEREAMGPAGGRVQRMGDSLVFRGAQGRPLVLEDVTSPEERTVVYRYERFVPELEQHLVRMGFYEGGAWLMVDARTTDQTQLLGPPVVSPGRTRFATAALDLVAGYEPNGLQVWRVEEGLPWLEWEVRGGDRWGASGIEWRGEDALDFVRHEPYPAHPDSTVQRRMRLTLSGPGLQIAPAPR